MEGNLRSRYKDVTLQDEIYKYAIVICRVYDGPGISEGERFGFIARKDFLLTSDILMDKRHFKSKLKDIVHKPVSDLIDIFVRKNK